MSNPDLKSFIFSESKKLGFLDVKIAKAEAMQEEGLRLKSWLEAGRHGSMSYMENHFDKRTDPTLLVEETKSVVVLSYNYFPGNDSLSTQAPKISRYAYGRDYHKVVKKKLKALYNAIQEVFPHCRGRYFVDSAPVLERDWARRSGLAWTGKNTLSIHPKRGSYFFLATMMLNESLKPDEPIEDFCGTCRRCIDACPTEAIAKDGYVMDGSKCISYLSIENKGSIPKQYQDKMEDWIYGCDICQEVCPWNRFSQAHKEEQFLPSEALNAMTETDWKNLDEEKFNTLFYGSAVKRTKYQGLKRNIDFILEDE